VAMDITDSLREVNIPVQREINPLNVSRDIRNFKDSIKNIVNENKRNQSRVLDNQVQTNYTSNDDLLEIGKTIETHNKEKQIMINEMIALKHNILLQNNELEKLKNIHHSHDDIVINQLDLQK